MDAFTPRARVVQSPSDVLAIARGAEYTSYNEGRYASAFAACEAVAPDRATRVLDIGFSDFTRRLRDRYDDVWTLGFVGPTEKHIVYNLNDAPHHSAPTTERFDLICFNEVLEHLYTAPEQVLAVVAELLRPGGHLIIQTPNAAALNKRLVLLTGRNPFERVRTDLFNPGHFRELTKAELAEVSIGAGFDIVDHRCIEYAGVYGRSWRNLALPVLKAAVAIWPTFARSQQIVLRKR